MQGQYRLVCRFRRVKSEELEREQFACLDDKIAKVEKLEDSLYSTEYLTVLLRGQKAFTMEDIRDVLNSIGKHNFNSPFASTERSIVYNQQTGKTQNYHRENYDTGYSFRLDKKSR